MCWEHLGSLIPPAEQGHPESFKLVVSMARAKGVGGPTEKKTLDFICSSRNVSQEMVRTRVGKSPPPAWHYHPTLRKAEGGLPGRSRLVHQSSARGAWWPINISCFKK